jgi:hypothetical protein
MPAGKLAPHLKTIDCTSLKIILMRATVGPYKMRERQLGLEDFVDKVGTAFALKEEVMAVSGLMLESAEAVKSQPASPGARAPFSLIFRGPDASVLPQGNYQLHHDGLGDIAIFIVPVGKDPEGVEYQALFN